MKKAKSRAWIEKKFNKALKKLRDEHFLISSDLVMSLMQYDEESFPRIDEKNGIISYSLIEFMDFTMKFGSEKLKRECEKLKAKRDEELAALERRK